MSGMLYFGFAIIWAIFYGLVGGVVLKVAYRMFFRKHSMQYAEAFSYMFIAGMFAFEAHYSMSLGGIDSQAMLVALPMLVNFAAITLVLLCWEGLTPMQAFGVGGIASGLFVLVLLAIQMALTGVLGGAAASP